MKYDYLINQPRPASTRPKMSEVDRTAEFTSFVALMGLDEQIDETEDGGTYVTKIGMAKRIDNVFSRCCLRMERK